MSLNDFLPLFYEFERVIKKTSKKQKVYILLVYVFFMFFSCFFLKNIFLMQLLCLFYEHVMFFQ